MHFCTANIKLAGDARNVVHRDAFAPISWPEVDVLRFIHGEDAVTDVRPFVSFPQSAKAEKDRLRLIYGDVVEHVFPGRNPQMELEAPTAKLPAQAPLWVNPIDPEPAGFDVSPEERKADGLQAEAQAEAEAPSGLLKKKTSSPPF